MQTESAATGNSGNLRRIVSVRVESVYDDTGIDHMADYIGEYSNTPGEGAIDREERGHIGRNEYRYFNPCLPEYAEEDYKRAEEYSNGYWWYVGIRARAEVVLACGCSRTVETSGLWGIESDSGDYLREVGDDALCELTYDLSALGFTDEEIAGAMPEDATPIDI